MAKITINDDTGETYESDQFIAVILQEGGLALALAEADQLDYEQTMLFLIQGQKMLGELANSLTAAPEEEEP